MQRLYFFILLLVAFSLSGCGQPDWWVGTWQFDRQYTEQHLTASADKTKEEKKKTDALRNLVLNMVFSMVEKNDITITSSEIIIMKDGSEDRKPYRVIKRSSANSVELEVGNEISTYTREGDHISMSNVNAGNVNVDVYFKRVK